MIEIYFEATPTFELLTLGVINIFEMRSGTVPDDYDFVRMAYDAKPGSRSRAVLYTSSAADCPSLRDDDGWHLLVDVAFKATERKAIPLRIATKWLLTKVQGDPGLISGTIELAEATR